MMNLKKPVRGTKLAGKTKSKANVMKLEYKVMK